MSAENKNLTFEVLSPQTAIYLQHRVFRGFYGSCCDYILHFFVLAIEDVGLRSLSTPSTVEKSASTRSEKKSRFDIYSASSDQLLNLLVMQNTSNANLTNPGFQMPTNLTTKCVAVKLEIPLRCDVSFIDYEVSSRFLLAI